MIKVDLASKEAGKIAKANRLIDQMRTAAAVLLGVFVLFVGSVYGYFFYTTNQVTQIDAKVQAIVNQLGQKTEAELLYRRLVDIVDEANKLVVSRKDFSGVLLDVYDLLPGGVSIEGVRFEDRTVIVDVRAIGVQNMSRAVAVLSTVTVENNSRFNEVALSAVRRSDDGTYVLRVELGLVSAI